MVGLRAPPAYLLARFQIDHFPFISMSWVLLGLPSITTNGRLIDRLAFWARELGFIRRLASSSRSHAGCVRALFKVRWSSVCQLD